MKKELGSDTPKRVELTLPRWEPRKKYAVGNMVKVPYEMYPSILLEVSTRQMKQANLISKEFECWQDHKLKVLY